MKKTTKIICYAICTLGLLACSSTPQLPQQFTESNDTITIYPDYRDVTIPPNIAPTNFQVTNDCEEAVMEVCGAGQTIVANTNEQKKVAFDAKDWKSLLEANKGKHLSITIYTKKDGTWRKHPAFNIYVAEETIDKYLSYRLIEPSYELYRQLGIYQRDLENFDEKAIYENNRSYENDNNHCINCHNYQSHSTDRMLFHVRAKHGGTILIDNGEVQKLNMRNDSVLSNTVYPAWHPTEKWIVFSSNKTGQAFHMLHPEKVEVIDYGSDLVFFDAEKKQLTNICKTKATMETFPCWHPEGNKIFYCAAHVPALDTRPDSTHSDVILSRYDTIRYNVFSRDFNPATKTFGEPRAEVLCDTLGKSATVPRVSPDGRYLLFTLGDYGQFHIWHHSADLYIKDLQTGAMKALTNANSERAESYHVWSSNGRWIAFASRRDDSSFSRVYIAYFSKDGEAHKAFLLPQEDPEHNLLRLKSYNVPELTKNAVSISPEQLREVIYNDEQTQTVTYAPAPSN